MFPMSEASSIRLSISSRVSDLPHSFFIDTLFNFGRRPPLRIDEFKNMSLDLAPCEIGRIRLDDFLDLFPGNMALNTGQTFLWCHDIGGRMTNKRHEIFVI